MRYMRHLAIFMALVIALSSCAVAESNWTIDITDIHVDVGTTVANLKPTARIILSMNDDYSEAWMTVNVYCNKKRLEPLYVYYSASEDRCLIRVEDGSVTVSVPANAIEQYLGQMTGEEDLGSALEMIDIALLVDEAPATLGTWDHTGNMSYSFNTRCFDANINCAVSWDESTEGLTFMPARDAIPCDDLDKAISVLRDDLRSPLHTLFADGTVWYLVKACFDKDNML